MRSSIYTEARLHPWMATGAAVLGSLALRLLLGGRVAASGGNATVGKALHIQMEAKPGREACVQRLMQDILGAIEDEPRALPWYGLHRGSQEFGIFQTFPDELARVRHLASPGARMLLARSVALLARLPRIRHGRADG